MKNKCITKITKNNFSYKIGIRYLPYFGSLDQERGVFCVIHQPTKPERDKCAKSFVKYTK